MALPGETIRQFGGLNQALDRTGFERRNLSRCESDWGWVQRSMHHCLCVCLCECVCVMGPVGGWMSRQHDGAVLQQLFLSDSELILRMSC